MFLQNDIGFRKGCRQIEHKEFFASAEGIAIDGPNILRHTDQLQLWTDPEAIRADLRDRVGQVDGGEVARGKSIGLNPPHGEAVHRFRHDAMVFQQGGNGGFQSGIAGVGKNAEGHAVDGLGVGRGVGLTGQKIDKGYIVFVTFHLSGIAGVAVDRLYIAAVQEVSARSYTGRDSQFCDVRPGKSTGSNHLQTVVEGDGGERLCAECLIINGTQCIVADQLCDAAGMKSVGADIGERRWQLHTTEGQIDESFFADVFQGSGQIDALHMVLRTAALSQDGADAVGQRQGSDIAGETFRCDTDHGAAAQSIGNDHVPLCPAAP